MKIQIVLLVLLLLTTSCATNSSGNDIKMHFGDLPDNPFVFEQSKKKGVK